MVCGRPISSKLLLSVLMLVLAALSTELSGAITTVGNISPTYPGGNPWDIPAGTELRIGITSDGSLTINQGYSVNAGDTSYLGHGAGTRGTATITDSGSAWTNAANLYIGYNGLGSLFVQNAGQVTSNAAGLGAQSGSVGAATVAGTGSVWNNAGPMYVGGYGQGTLTVRNGGRTGVGQALYIGGYDSIVFPEASGSEPNGSGTVIVTGAGSLLEVSGTASLYVGYSGNGTLDVNDGGQVVSYRGHIGYTTGTQGVVRLTGQDSLWDVGENLYVGGESGSAGGTGLLMLSDGARLSVGNNLVVWETGTLGGHGTIDVPTLNNFGTIASPNSVGTLTVTGDVIFDVNSAYEVEVDSNNTSDKLVASTVDIQGGTVRVSWAGTVAGTTRFEIIDANSVTGTFNTLEPMLLHFWLGDPVLEYDANSVWLSITAVPFDDPNVWETCNQARLGGALQQISEAGGSDITDALQALDDINDIRRAYDQLAGQSRPPLAPLTIAGTSRFFGAATSRMHALQMGTVAGMSDSSLLAMAGPSGNAGGRAYDSAPRDPTFSVGNPRQDPAFTVGNGSTTLADRKWGFWSRGYGLFGDRKAESGTPGYDYDTYGVSLGLDYQFTDEFLVGVVGGLAEGSADFSGSQDSTDFEATHIGLYASLAWEEGYVDAMALQASLEYDTKRFVDLMGEQLTGNFEGSEIAAYIETGSNWDLAPNALLQPFVSLQYASLDLDAYTETGGSSALGFDEQTYDSLKASLGARLTWRLIESMGDFQVDAQLRGRWVHEFGDDQSNVDAHFATDPTAVFTVSDENISRDSAVLGAGLSVDVNKQLRAYADYDLRLNSDETAHIISAALQYRW